MGRLGRVTWRLPASVMGSEQLLQRLPNGQERHERRLLEAPHFGDNPGNLRMLKHIPAGFEGALPLVVVLHGCKQTAASYDLGAGWSALADEYGFALLFPEQKPENNPNNCFTWFDARDTSRNAGEAASIKNMIDAMISDHDIDPRRVFVTGLSAGGAMTSVMLATYPEVFSAGAIIAGLPYGAAGNVQEALSSMFQGSRKTSQEWGALVREGSPHSGPWPRISIWHGDADKTVVPGNATESVKQWTDVHGSTITGAENRDGPGFTKLVWRNDAGLEVVESVIIPGLAHGTPLGTRAVGEGCGESCGEPGPYLIDAGVSSTHHIARFFGLIEPNNGDPTVTGFDLLTDKDCARVLTGIDSPAEQTRITPTAINPAVSRGSDISSIINAALKSAGLIKQ